MNEGSYRFKIGDFDCVSLSDGYHDYPPKNFFANVSEEKVQEILRSRNLPTDHIRTPYTYLYANTGEHRVLVDMGAPKSPTTGLLTQSMKAAGIDPGEIEAVIITHAHPDHIGGTLDEEGKPVYTNARYFISKREWGYWFSEAALKQAEERFVQFAHLARKMLEPVKDRISIVEFADNEAEILPGIRGISAPGHTPGHMVVSLSSSGVELMYIGDTVLSPIHLEPTDWLPVYDTLPEEAEDSKHRIFDLAAERNAWVIGQHFPPFPSLGHIIKRGKGWQWQGHIP